MSPTGYHFDVKHDGTPLAENGATITMSMDRGTSSLRRPRAMKLGDHPDLYQAIVEALGGLSWASGVAVWASDAPAGYRVTVSTGDRFLVHQRTIVIPLSRAKARNLAHTVKGLIDEMRLDLEKT